MKRTLLVTLAATLALLAVPASSLRAEAGQEQPPENAGDKPPTEGAHEEGTSDSVQEPLADLPGFLDQILVTATGAWAEDFSLPYTVDVLEVDDLHSRRQVRSLPEALGEIPAVMVQKTSHGQGSPYIRGFTGFRTLLMIDGIRLNNSVFRDGPNQYWNTIDAQSLGSLEVVKGPSSVLWGSDAIGGTVNALSLRPAVEGDRIPTSGRLNLRYSSAGSSFLGRLQLQGGGSSRLSYSGGITFKDFGDLRSGGSLGRQPKTGYDEQDGDFLLEYRIADHSRLVAAYQKVTVNDAWRPHRTIFAVSWRGTTVGSEKQRILDQRRSLGYLQYHWLGEGRLFDALTASLSYHRQEEERFRERSGSRFDRQGFDVGTLGAFVRLEKATDRSIWTYGAEQYRDNVDSFKHDLDSSGAITGVEIQGPIADDATYNLLGVYIQNERQPTSRLSLILGARFTFAEADAKRVKDPTTGLPIAIVDDWDNLVGNARLLYRLDGANRWHLFGGLSQGFRAPNLSDLTRLDTARSNEIETAAPGLEPENFLAYEAGVKFRKGGTSAEVAVFYTDIDKMIIRTPTGRIVDGDHEVTKKNGGRGFVSGIETSIETRLGPDWRLWGNLAWLDGEVDTFPTSQPLLVREPIDRLQPLTVHLGLGWEPSGKPYWLEAVLSLADRQDNLSSRDKADTSRIPPGGTPGFEVFSLRSGWEVNKRLRLSVAVENITDEDYRAHGSGLNAAGRNLVMSVNTGF